MAKPSPAAAKSNQACSTKGTAAYDDVLYRLGIDIETNTAVNNPEDINVDGLPPQPTVQYSHLRTHEQLHALAEQHKRYGKGLNEATLAARLMSNLFIFADVPDPDDPGRSVVPCQTLELAGAFTKSDRFNKSLYSYVRGPRKRGGIQPHESELRYRSDLTIMAYNNAVSCRLRGHCRDCPSVHNSYNAVAPFFSAEFKSDASPANLREATHQIAISSYISLVDRQRLRRLHSDSMSYTQDKNMRHYAYTICGTEVTVWVTRLETETTRYRSFTTYKVQQLAVLNLRRVAELKEFLEWHRRIITWCLGVYVGSYVQDLENTMGAPGRESLLILIMTEKEVTAPVQFGESAEQEEIEQAETEQEETEQATEQADTEQAETEQAETEQAETEQAETEQLPSALLGRSDAHGSSAFHSVSTSSRTQSQIPIRRGSALCKSLGQGKSSTSKGECAKENVLANDQKEKREKVYPSAPSGLPFEISKVNVRQVIITNSDRAANDFQPCQMTDLLSTLPDFPTAEYTHLIPSFEKNGITVADLLTLDSIEIVKRCPLPLLDVRRFVKEVIEAIQEDVGVRDVPTTTNDDLIALPGHEDARAPVQAFRQLISRWSAISALDTTLDKALGGGIPTGYVTEVTGESGVGKTQFLLTLLLSAQLPPPQGLSRSTIYMSTEAQISTKRLSQILSNHRHLCNLPASTRPSLDNVRNIPVQDLESQDHILEYQLPTMVRRYNVGLVVIDSIAANYRAEHGSSTPKDLANRAAQLAKLGRILRRLAVTSNLAVVVANQVSDRLESVVDRTTLNAISSSPSIASSPASQVQKASKETDPAGPTRMEVMSLDHQQRFFTGWGDDPRVSADELKTPALGLGWTNQIAARIVLKIARASVVDQAVGSWEEYVEGSLGRDRKKRRFLSLVFAPWVGGTLVPVEFEIRKEGIVSIGPKGQESEENEP